MASRTQFKANQVSDFNAGWYLGEYSDIGTGFDDWAGQQPMDFAHYVKSHPDLENTWRTTVQEPAYGKYPAETRWSWGEKHWNKYGQGEDRAMAYDLGDNYYIMSKDLANDQSAENTYGAWHFDSTGRNEGRFGTKQAWFDSPDEVIKRNDEEAATLKIDNDARGETDRQFLKGLDDADKVFQLDMTDRNELFQQGIRDDEKIEGEKSRIETARLAKEDRLFRLRMADVQKIAMQKAAARAEAGRLASRRGGGSQTLSASGAATFKGKGLKSSENKRGKGRGTGQFKRPYGTSNLSIAATGKGNQQSTLNL